MAFAVTAARLITASCLIWGSNLLAVTGTIGAEAAEESSMECKTFQEVFMDGRDLCERMYGDAFAYVPTSDFIGYELAYTMWFFSAKNPNDATTVKRILSGRHDIQYANTDVCHLKTPEASDHQHKDAPSPENESTFTECFPFQPNACCHEATVENTEVIKKNYGNLYAWDHCGKMSPQCERFFVQESCFYECDPNAGLFRKYPPTMTDKSNEWELYRLPIKGDYCDAWYNACRQDKFCSKGNIFQCGASSSSSSGANTDNNQTTQGGGGELTYSHQGISGGAIVAIIFLSFFMAAMCFCLVAMIQRERRGQPMFRPSRDRRLDSKSSLSSASVGGGGHRRQNLHSVNPSNGGEGGMDDLETEREAIAVNERKHSLDAVNMPPMAAYATRDVFVI